MKTNTCNHIELEFIKAWHGEQDTGHSVLDIRCTKCGRTGSLENCFEGCCCIRYDFEHDKLINNYRIIKKEPVACGMTKKWVSVNVENPPKKGYYQILTGILSTGLDGIERDFPQNAYFDNDKWYIGDLGIFTIVPTHWRDM